MLEFLALVIAIAAFIFARKALTQLKTMQARLEALEAGAPRAPAIATAPATPAAPTPSAVTAETTEIPLAPTLATEEVAADAAPSPAATAPAPVASGPVPPVSAPSPATAAKPGFEERLGTRWVVWVGGLTLALGGLFLVKYSIEQGLIGPAMRVALGGVFALALLAAGEWTRRKEAATATAPLPIANIPAILTAAGTVVAFGTVYASYALYDFLAPAAAFILLGVVALGTLAAALLHGPMLAGLGIAAAFVTPILVSSSKPDFWSLYVYLAVVTAAAFGLARIRMWLWLAVTTIVFGLFWGLVGLHVAGTVGAHDFHAVAGFALASLLVVAGLLFGPPAEPGRIEPVSSVSISVYTFLAMIMVVISHHTDSALIVFALLVAATLAVAWRAEAATGAVAAAAAMAALVFLSWVVQSDPDMLVLPGGPLSGGPRAIDASVTTHLVTALVFAAGFGGAGLLAQGRSSRALAPVVWSASGVFVPLALLVALYARIAHLDRSIPFAIVALALAAAFTAATEWLSRRDARLGLEASTALFATGALAALALAFTFALDKGWLTIALALMSAGTAWVSLRRTIPFLRWLSAILAGIVMLRIGYEPRIAGDQVGTTPIFNWLLYGYGVPAASFWLGAVLLRRRADDEPTRMLETAAILFTVSLVFMEIRHLVNNGDVYHDAAGLAEVALQVCSALAMAIGLERLRLRSGSIVHNVAALVLTGFAAVGTVFGLFLLEMPLFTGDPVGGPFFNLILLGYGLPAVLALALAHAVGGHRRPAYANSIAGGALVLALAYVTLQITRLYHGGVLDEGATTNAEQYTYSLAWLAFGVVLLAVGLAFGSQRARLASAVVIGLTVLKAFLIDMSSLTGVWRALSFMGLGLVLVAIGWLYQRILFKTQPPADEAAAATPTQAG